VTIEKLVAGGDGLGRFEGIPIFVPRAAPGARLRARLIARRPGYGRGEIVEVLLPGPERRDAPCPHFADCGGCDLQQIGDEAQVRYKAAAVRETLERLGGIEWPEPVEVIAGDAWGYRLRAGLRIERGEKTAVVGYRQRGSHRLVPVSRCPVLTPELEALVTRLPRSLPDEAPERIDLAAGDGGAMTTAPVVRGLPHGEVSRRVGDLTLSYDARCFFQAHSGLLADLVARVVGEWEGEEAFDLYAGVGLFSVALASRYRKVVAVEGDRVAARYARKNARENRLRGLEVEARAVESWISGLPVDAARVVVDPPRAGLSALVRRVLRRQGAERLTYVSCHAAAMARDLKELGATYRLESVTLLDLFPQTGHMEAVAQLVRR
jgi:23S rRNA (uracil1939-C5)-methyltransferase